MSYRIEVLGRPAPKGSRIAARTKAGKAYTYPASKYETPWINAVRDATRNVMRHHDQVGPPYVVDLKFLLSQPLRPNKDKAAWPTRHDLDKLVRAVIDGLVSGGAMADDRHVTELHAVKEYVEDPEQAGVIAFVYCATTAAQRAA